MRNGDEDSGAETANWGSVLYRHELRPEWGNAIALWERDDKRAYQFEDGQQRVFKEGFYEHLVEADTPAEERSATIAALRRRVGWKEETKTKRTAKGVKAVPVDQQVALFARLYPEGFSAGKWATDVRGLESTRRLKRHRDASILEAQKQLSLDRLESLRGVGKHAAIVDSIREVCDGTDLISKAQRGALDELDEAGTLLIAEAVIDLLHGEAAEGIRFERFVDALTRVGGKRPTWQLATILPALVHPSEHICIRPGAMRTQVACAGQPIKVAASPDAPTYLRLRDLALNVRDQLVKAGHTPRDLADIYDFITTTTSAKALREMQAAQAAESPALA